MTRKWIGVLALAALALGASAQRQQTEAEAAISNGIANLRAMLDEPRAAATRDLAFKIRQLPSGPSKVSLAYSLSNLATEGDFGYVTLKRVTDTLAAAVQESPPVGKGPYIQLANLVRYEGMKVELPTEAYMAALAEVDALAAERAKADFTLTDLAGKSWTRSALKGKVVLVNFWATWCPPCRKEMPDLDALSKRFKDKGLVILAISDEKGETVEAYLKEHPVSYPVLLDPGRKVHDLYKVDGIPKNLVYDRSGKLVAQSIDMRTMPQFLKMLGKAGIK